VSDCRQEFVDPRPEFLRCGHVQDVLKAFKD
jgi:hypothetical protein